MPLLHTLDAWLQFASFAKTYLSAMWREHVSLYVPPVWGANARVGEKERLRQTERDRQTETETDGQRQRHRDRETETDRDNRRDGTDGRTDR